MHDATVDRTTTSTGNTVDGTAATFAALEIDSDAVLGGAFGNTLHPPLLSGVLKEFKGRAVMSIEAKAGPITPMLAAIATAGLRKDQVMFGEFGTTAGAAAVSNGYQGFYINNDNSTSALGAVVAAGIQWVVLPETVLDATIATWIAAGRKVLLYVTDRRNVRDAKIALGVSGFYSDEPIYVGRSTPIATRDTWTTGNWMPGMLDENLATGATTRGRFYPEGRWGWADTGKRFVLQGWACPIKGDPAASDFSITFKVKFGTPTNTARWASIFVADASMGDTKYSDDGLSSESGYHFLMRSSSGAMDVYKRVTGVATLLQTVDTPDIAVDEEVQYRVTFTPTTVAIYRLDGLGSVTHSNVVTNSEMRGGYFHTGHSGVSALFSDMVIT